MEEQWILEVVYRRKEMVEIRRCSGDHQSQALLALSTFFRAQAINQVVFTSERPTKSQHLLELFKPTVAHLLVDLEAGFRYSLELEILV
mmetsp:Transcript_32486/g.62411  ORF Transcript_32486/g.62411 Transcript_32486/m.62411 type:complete len:89 (+) Transcript_32486:831-1097(+)